MVRKISKKIESKIRKTIIILYFYIIITYCKQNKNKEAYSVSGLGISLKATLVLKGGNAKTSLSFIRLVLVFHIQLKISVYAMWKMYLKFEQGLWLVWP